MGWAFPPLADAGDRMGPVGDRRLRLHPPASSATSSTTWRERTVLPFELLHLELLHADGKPRLRAEPVLHLVGVHARPPAPMPRPSRSRGRRMSSRENKPSASGIADLADVPSSDFSLLLVSRAEGKVGASTIPYTQHRVRRDEHGLQLSRRPRATRRQR